MPVPDFADPRPPYVQIAADLRDHLAAGRYEPGQRLPTNAELRVQYRSANETVRRALGVLRDEGLIETHSTRGTFVIRAPGVEPDLHALAEGLSGLRGEFQTLAERVEEAGAGELAAAVGRIEANLIDLYGKLGFDYPREVPSGARTGLAGERKRRREHRA